MDDVLGTLGRIGLIPVIKIDRPVRAVVRREARQAALASYR